MDYRARSDIEAAGYQRMLTQYRAGSERTLGGPRPALLSLSTAPIELVTVNPFRIPPSKAGYAGEPFTAITQQVWHQDTYVGNTSRFISGVENDPNVGLPTPVYPPAYAGGPYTILMRLRVEGPGQFVIDLPKGTPRQQIQVFVSERVDGFSGTGMSVRLTNGETTWRHSHSGDLAFNDTSWVAWSVAGLNGTQLINTDGVPSSIAGVSPSQTRSWFGAESSKTGFDYFPNVDDKRGFQSVMSEVYYWAEAFDAPTLAELVQWVLDGHPVVA